MQSIRSGSYACRFLVAMKLARASSQSISAATVLYSSSTQPQRWAARFTNTFAMGPIKLASSLLTESRRAGSRELGEESGAEGLGLGGLGFGEAGDPADPLLIFCGSSPLPTSPSCRL